MIGGKIIARVEDATAPTREINSPIFGIAAAKTTKEKFKY